jgi:regulatory protein
MKNTKPLKPILDTATAILARREHSTMELRRKLATKGYPKPEIEDLIQTLLAKNYLNDARYAEIRARTRAHHSKWGAGRIRQELAQQGIAKDTAIATLAELSETEDWLATATKLIQRKFPNPLPTLATADPSLGRNEAAKKLQQEKARRIAFLTRRGFTLQQSLQALQLSISDIEE